VLRRDAPLGGSLEVLEETCLRLVVEALEETLWTGSHKEYR
jgi:hypothetical protein